MKSALVALDETATSQTAIDLGIELARRFSCPLSGISVVDIDYIAGGEAVPLGASHYKERLDAARVQRAHISSKSMLSSLSARCKSAGVAVSTIELEGDPVALVQSACARHDVVILGRDATFHGGGEGVVAGAVERLLKGQARPIIVATDTARLPSRILVCYDGSIAAARSVQLFVLLGLAKDCELHLASVGDSKASCETNLQQVQQYLALHGLGGDAHALVTNDNPEDALLSTAARIDADLLVMGAYGHRGWREAILGSCTTGLLATSPVPLFIYH